MKSRIVRASTAALVLMATMTVAGSAIAKPVSRAEPRDAQADKVSALKRQAEAAQRVAETRERLWDQKMKAVSGSICIGC